MTIGNNSANFNSCADWDGINGNFTTVGTNGGPSAYDTFDQAGNGVEIIDGESPTGGSLELRQVRNTFPTNTVANFMSASNSGGIFTSQKTASLTLRIASSYSTLNPLGLSNFVTIGDENNIADTGGTIGQGSVRYTYTIGKYKITNNEYKEFLNAIASTDTYQLYSTNQKITRSGTSGSYSYIAQNNYENKPVTSISWFDCARYCNWLHNGRLTGIQDNSTTESGAYLLNGATTGNAVRKNIVGATFTTLSTPGFADIVHPISSSVVGQTSGAAFNGGLYASNPELSLQKGGGTLTGNFVIGELVTVTTTSGTYNISGNYKITDIIVSDPGNVYVTLFLADASSSIIFSKYHIPTENEWYKAAYYKGGSTNAGYWKYATQSNTDPTCVCASSVGDGIVCGASESPTPTPTVTPTPTPTQTIIGCDHKILKLYIPNSIISPGGTRASSIQLRIGGGSCCSRSNIRDMVIPPLPPTPPPPQPEVCLGEGIDLYGYTAIISYDPVNCGGGHVCNRAIFDFYIDNILIGQANLNNGGDGGYREGIFTINSHIITSSLTELKLVCSSEACHNGIGRVVLKDTSDNIVLAMCMPNDIVIAGSFICPCPKVLGSTHNIAANALNTNIQVDAGSQLIISATGSIDIGWPDHPGAYGPDGIPGIGNDPISGFPYISLLGRIGESGAVFFVGSSYDSVVNESGELYLFFYDPEPSDNTGYFNACVTQI